MAVYGVEIVNFQQNPTYLTDRLSLLISKIEHSYKHHVNRFVRGLLDPP